MNDIYADFEFSGDGTQVLKCPAGHKPNHRCYLQKNGQCQLSFDREQCANCQHKGECKAKIFKKVSSGYGLDTGDRKVPFSKG